MRFVFANNWISAVGSGGLGASETTHTPAVVTGAPLCDPTLDDPTVMPLVIGVDPDTRRPGSGSEVVYVLDNRTTPWVLQRAAESMVGGVAAGEPIDHTSGEVVACELTQGVLDAMQNSPDISTLAGVSGLWTPTPGYALQINPGGLVQPLPPNAPSLIDVAANRSGISDGHSTIPSSSPYSTGNPVTVTDGSSNPLQIVVPADLGSTAELHAVIPMIKDAVARTDTLAHFASAEKLAVVLTIAEGTELINPGSLAGAGLTPMNFVSGWIPVPNIANGQFKADTHGHFLDTSPIDRYFGIAYQIYSQVGGDSYLGGAWVQNVNLADVVSGGQTYRTGTRLYATAAVIA